MKVDAGHCLDVTHSKILFYRFVIKYAGGNFSVIYIKTN